MTNGRRDVLDILRRYFVSDGYERWRVRRRRGTDGYKVLTHDYRPPIRGGAPVWDGRRKTLDKVELDTTGLRDAYRHGLAIAIPAGLNTLGWAMEERGPTRAKR